MRDYKFCPFCAHELATKFIDGKHRQFCLECNFVQYQNPLPTVVCIGEIDGKILLIKRGIEPSKGHWTLPSGFIELGESPEECCLRELKEEAGLTGTIVKLIGLYHVHSSLYGDLISSIFHVKLDPGEPTAGDDAEDAKLIPMAEVGDLRFATFNEAFAIFKQGL